MKIVVLDGYTLNPGDLNWDELKKLGDLVVYERTPVDKVVERASGAEVLFTNKCPVSAEAINQLSSLKFIGVLATGYNIVNTEAAKAKGIIVANVPVWNYICCANDICFISLNCACAYSVTDAVMDGKWTRSADFCFWDYPPIELSGKNTGHYRFWKYRSASG
jgi:glycerate dehydrogenase